LLIFCTQTLHSPSYYYEPKDSSAARPQAFKGCVDLLRATVAKGANDLSLVVNTDPTLAAQQPHKFKSFTQLVMYAHFTSLGEKL
jgi:hypothetical protein